MTPVLGDVLTAVDYTDSTGHTYYYLADGTTKIDAGMADVPTGESTVGITISIAKGDFSSAAEVLAAWNNARSTNTHVRVTITPTAPVKVGSTSAGAYGATKGTAMTIDFAVNALEAANWVLTGGTNYVYTSGTSAWFYGVEGDNSVETGVSTGRVDAGVSMVLPA